MPNTKCGSDEISRQISIIGMHIKQQGGSRVAIYLPNSIELITALFACTFYGRTPILLPYDQPSATIISKLKQSNADTLIVAPLSQIKIISFKDKANWSLIQKYSIGSKQKTDRPASI